MHCDVLVGEEVEASHIPVIHEPPRRVFTRLPATAGLAVSDYLYPGEGRKIVSQTPSADIKIENIKVQTSFVRP